METLISRYRNVTILVAILFAQVLGLAVQVKRNTEDEPTRLIRIWAINAVSPFERAIVWGQNGVSGLWHNYFYLRGIRQENRDLKSEIQRLRIEQVRLGQDAEQARRLQALLSFKEQFISQTVAAQVIGSSGSEQSRSIYIDKGARDGIKPDMAVMTADGVVGKVLRVFGGKPLEASVSQVLLINDQSSGVGAILEKSRVQGVLKGTSTGEVVLERVMSDEIVPPGERVITSGGDQIFPKGMPVGTVVKSLPGSGLFLSIRVKPAADLSKLEEVLVITKMEEQPAPVADGTRIRAADILAQRLPSVPDKPVDDASKAGATAAVKPGASTTVPAVSRPAAEAAVPPRAGVSATTLKPNAPAGNGAEKPGGNPNPQAVTEKPTVKPQSGAAANPAQVKPATAQKPAPPTVKVSESVGSNAGAGKPKPQNPPASKSATPPTEDKPH